MGQICIFRKIQLRNWVSLIAILFPLLLQAQISVSVIPSSTNCFGSCDGAASASVSGGTLPYTYAWSTGGTGAFLQNLCAGTYTVTVSDANQNTSVGTGTIVQPNQLTAIVLTENQICGIAPDGSASVSVTGGTAPFSYVWSNDSTGNSISGLTEGTYSVTVTDLNGCTAVGFNTVFFWNEGIWLMDTVTNISCFGASDGTGHVGPMTGTPPYDYTWSTSSADTTQDITNLGPGTYSVTVVDANGCSNTTSVTVEEPTPLTAVVDSTEAACGQPGSATVTPSGGTPGYTLQWNNNDTTSTTNGPAGPISVTVTDANGCEFVLDFSIPGNNVMLSVTTDVTGQAQCLLGGSAQVSASGGSGNFSYAWSSSSSDTSPAVTDLQVGVYTVTITENPSGCTGTATAQITEKPSDLSVTATVINAAGCTIGGSATASAEGGIPPYKFAWNGTVVSNPHITSLDIGQYIVVVTDSAGCTATDTIQIVHTPLPTVVAAVDTMVTCTSNGSAIAMASDGISPYKYAWSSGALTAAAPNLQAGTYTVIVTDSVGCSASATVTLTEPENPTVDISGVINATCTVPGSATATATGGLGPYTYLWDNGDNTATTTNLGPGQHTVTATDFGGCNAVDTVQIIQPDAPSVTTQMLTKANCVGGGGSATATASGGTPGYTFEWSSGGTTDTEINLAAATYTVTVTDSLGCTATATVTIQEVDPPTVSPQVTAVATCNTGGTADAMASGGTPGYTYLWSNNGTTAIVSDLAAGSYTVTVTDNAGCTAVDSVSVAPPLMPMVDIITSDSASCSTPGAATAASTGGTPPYFYVWDNGETGAVATNLSPGVHTVTVTDGGNCMDTDTVLIANSDSSGIQVGDFVWFDLDQNGLQGPDTIETGVDSIIVMLMQAGPDGEFNTPDDVTVATTQTDSLGKYLFSCVPPGTYIVMFSGIPAGYQFAKKDAGNKDCKDSDANKQGKTAPFTIAPGQNSDNLCIDAGIHIICDPLLNAGTICCNQTICEGETPSLLYETVAPWGGSGNDLTYLWLQLVQIGPAPPTWVGIPGATQIDYQPGPLNETAYFMRCVLRNGCVTFIESNVITITVIPAGTQGCPQSISNFNVSAMSPSTVQVGWTTMPELSRYIYTVERSMDKNIWTVVEEVMGHEDATGPNHYSVMDHTPGNGMNYYRVKRRSASGVEIVSEIKQIEMNMSQKESMAVYPNPVAQILYIRNLIAYEADARVEIYTVSGQLLHTLKVPAGTFQNFEVPMADLQQGIYITRIHFGDGEVKTMKISKM